MTKFKNHIEIADQGISQGVAAGIEVFIKKRGIDVSPGPGSPSPVAAFTVAFIGEFSEANDIYPYETSFKSQCGQAMEQLLPVLKVLFEAGEIDQALSLARTIFYGETLIFLDAHLKETIDIIKAIRETEIKP